MDGQDFQLSLDFAKSLVRRTNTVLVSVTYHVKLNTWSASIQPSEEYSVSYFPLNKPYKELVADIEAMKASYAAWANDDSP